MGFVGYRTILQEPIHKQNMHGMDYRFLKIYFEYIEIYVDKNYICAIM